MLFLLERLVSPAVGDGSHYLSYCSKHTPVAQPIFEKSIKKSKETKR